MRSRIARTRVAFVVAVLAVLALSGATAQAVTSADPVLSTTQRGWCVRSGTGELRNLWLVEATGLCPAPFWGPTSLGTPGPAGPKGDKGDPGPNSIVFGHASLTITGNVDTSVTITGQPAFSALIGARTLVTTNQAGAPASLSVTPVPPAVGATTRVFHVVASAWGSAPDYSLTIDTLTVVQP